MTTLDERAPARAVCAAALPEIMRDVHREEGYYARIPYGERASEQFASRESVDPDGRVRDLHAERAEYLDGIATELAWLGEWAQWYTRPVRILDVGCGYGRLLSALDPPNPLGAVTPFGRAAWERFGVEPSEHSAGYAREHGTIHVGTIESAPEEWQGFDVAVLYHVIDHMEDPVAVMREAIRRVRPGGRVLVGACDFDSPMARRYRERYRLLHDPTHISLFSTESLLRCLRDIGLEVERIDYPLPARLDTEEARAAAEKAGVSPPARGNVVTMYARRP